MKVHQTSGKSLDPTPCIIKLEEVFALGPSCNILVLSTKCYDGFITAMQMWDIVDKIGLKKWDSLQLCIKWHQIIFLKKVTAWGQKMMCGEKISKKTYQNLL